MKLIVFTPANTKSAIGRMAALVTSSLLVQGCEVTVVRTEVKHLQSTDVHDFGVRILSWDVEEEVREMIRSSDAGIYHIGNNFEYHEGGVRWLAEFPGLVCLHDFFLGHLFYGWAQTHRAQAQSVLHCWYGEEMAERFFSFNDSESFIEFTLVHMPLTEWICSQADAVITHSSWGCDRVMNSCPGPVSVVPLAYDAPTRLVKTPVDMPASGQTLQLLTIGHVNPNKRIESVIQAIGLSPLLRNRVNYQVVGAVEPAMMNSLSGLAKRLGVNLVISGEVDADGLERAISESDVICCLRWPALEAASASAIEAMLYGKAVIVTDTGFYAEIPDSCAIKINYANEIPELQSALEVLLVGGNRALDMGKEAQAWASESFTPQNYAIRLTEIINDVCRIVPSKRAVNSFCDILSRWSSNGSPFVTPYLTEPLSIFENQD